MLTFVDAVFEELHEDQSFQLNPCRHVWRISEALQWSWHSALSIGRPLYSIVTKFERLVSNMSNPLQGRGTTKTCIATDSADILHIELGHGTNTRSWVYLRN